MKPPEPNTEESVIYVTHQGAQVRKESGRIVVSDRRGDENELASFPIEQVDTVNVFGGVNFTTPFIKAASKDGISLNYFSQYGEYRGSYVPERNTIAEIREAQYGLTEEKKIEIAKTMIGAKIRNQRTLLARKDVYGTERLRALRDDLGSVATKSDIRGIEGEAAERYFDRLDETLASGWSFETRSKRPPKDHINALLSLSYTFLKNEVLSALRQYNLDPFLGVLHANRHGRPALALDLQEEFRPIFSDALSTRLVNRQVLTHDDFKANNHLTDDAFQTFLQKFEDFMQEKLTHPYFDYQVTRRTVIRYQVILLRKAITNELDDYHPFSVSR